MKVNYDIEVPISDKEDVNLIFKFVESEHKSMLIEYENAAEANSRSSVLRSANSRKKLGLVFKRIENKVYIEKLN